MDVMDLILECATIPSFSSFEEAIHPWVEGIVKNVPQAKIEYIPENNLFIEIPGKRPGPAVALSAHLDKINHFGEKIQTPLEAERKKGGLNGQLDDSVGIGICMHILLQSKIKHYPTLYILLSEMEESMGLKRHPHLLRNGGEGLYSGMGAERLAEYLLQRDKIPGIVFTIDTTPLFGGSSGIALYSRHWEKNGLSPSRELIEKTTRIEAEITRLCPSIQLHNNENDYLEYGKILNRAQVVPSIAVEPAIFPYHQVGEKVYTKDILQITSLLDELLSSDSFLQLLCE